MRFFTLIAAVGLAGCSALVTSTGPRSVTVDASPMQAQDALDLAEKECAKHGRHAKINARPGLGNPRQWAFDCVE